MVAEFSQGRIRIGAWNRNEPCSNEEWNAGLYGGAHDENGDFTGMSRRC